MSTEIIRHMSVDETMTLATTFVKSGFFQDTREASQAVVKILAGRELGFGPMASMTGVYIVKGKVSLSANLIAAAIKRSGRYDYRVREMTDVVCRVEFFQDGESIGESAFTIDDAKAAGLLANATWKAYPRNMLFARAMSNGARWYCPDVFGGPLYTPDELGATVDGETGEVIDHGDVVDVPMSPGAAAMQERIDAWRASDPPAMPPPDPANDEKPRRYPKRQTKVPAAEEPHWTTEITQAITPAEAEALLSRIEETTTGAHRSKALAMCLIQMIGLSASGEDLDLAKATMRPFKAKLATDDWTRVVEAGTQARETLDRMEEVLA